jgi:predicted acyltransferase
MGQPESSTALYEGAPEGRAVARVSPPAAPAAPPPAGRFVSLDAYRGFTMLAMVSAGLRMQWFKGDPTWGWLAEQVEHAEWRGCTAWDLIQPSFMFIVGVAMPFAFARRQERGESWLQQLGHVARRCLLLVLVGVLLDCYAEHKPVVQFIRVLQQIAVGYFLAFLVLHAGPRVQAGAAVLFLVGHTLLFFVYGRLHGLDPWLQQDNVGVWLDLKLQHALNHVPGVSIIPLSTGGYVTLNALSSAATILFGVLCGEFLRAPGRRSAKAGYLLLAGLVGLGLGWALEGKVPMIKRVWTASFAVYAAGWTCLLMALFYGVIDGLGWRRWSFPLLVIGMNSIAVYVVAGTLHGNLRHFTGAFVDGPLAGSPRLIPVVEQAGALVLTWLIFLWFYRRRIFFKV